MDQETRKKQARLVINMLERLSADSIWAHRASGLRGSLIHCLDYFDNEKPRIAEAKMDALLSEGFSILELSVRSQYKK
jgi:hypothetical protein